MKKLLVLLLGLASASVFAAGGGHNEYIVKAPLNLNDKVSLQHGFQLFVNNCIGCHSAQYMRYERAANDLDIPVEILQDNLLFTTDKVGETIISAMPQDLAKTWFGAAPPDLTLVARVRGADWVYSYLTNFYPDESRPWNVNNHVFPDVGMPHVLSNMEKDLGEKDFNQAMADLTNFMVYMAAPIRAERIRIGTWVLIFLAVLFIPVYFMKKEFWKDIH